MALPLTTLQITHADDSVETIDLGEESVLTRLIIARIPKRSGPSWQSLPAVPNSQVASIIYGDRTLSLPAWNIKAVSLS